MSSRREFMQGGALAAGALAVGTGALLAQSSGAVAAGGRDQQRSRPLYTVVYDDRFADSIAFAAQAQRQGERVRSLDQGDVTRLWYDDLYHRWKRGAAAIAGLTTYEAAFVLETFGNDAGLRCVFRADHRVQAGSVEHRLNGPSGMVRQTQLDQHAAAWGARVAQLLNRFPDYRQPAQVIERASLTGGAAVQPLRLVSWVLAPVRRAA